jgi:hypothetical protein
VNGTAQDSFGWLTPVPSGKLAEVNR